MSTTYNEAAGRAVILTGPNNYADWELSIRTHLILRDLEIRPPVKLGDNPSPQERENNKKARQAFALIIQSLSPEVQASLPAHIRSVDSADSLALWEELKTQYSAAVGARKALLFQQMWATPLAEGEDPAKVMGDIRSAHAQINCCGETLSDEALAYAMTLALPESFTTVKQTLWLQTPLTSAAVQSAVQSEWSRRSNGQPATAHKVLTTRTPNDCPKGNKTRKWTEKWCSIHKVSTHNTRDCSLRHNYSTNTGQAKSVTHGSSETEELNNTPHATAVVAKTTSKSDFTVDSGASHHMVYNKDLLHDYGPSTITKVKLGNGMVLPVAGQGNIQLETITLQQVLHVPALKCNLLAVNKIQPQLCWSFSNTEGKLIDQSTNKVLLSAPFANGAYSLQNGIEN